MFLSISLVFFFVKWLDTATGPIRKIEFFYFIINFFNKFKLFISTFKTEENFKEQNLNAIKFKCDITSKTEIQELYQFVKTKFKKLDILINNAGVTFPHSSLDYPENFWEDTYKVNLKAPFELCKIFGKMMKESNSGVIINITTLGAELAFPDNPSYGAFKAGLKHLTKTLALDLGKFGIRVNNVSPGYMRTDMTKKSWDDPILRQKRTDRTKYSTGKGNP